MLFLLSWLVYGFIVGTVAKLLHPGEDPIGFWPTVGIGIAGSYIGGFINFLLGHGSVFSTSGLLMGVIGGIVFCFIYSKYHLNKFMQLRGQQKDDK